MLLNNCEFWHYYLAVAVDVVLVIVLSYKSIPIFN